MSANESPMPAYAWPRALAGQCSQCERYVAALAIDESGQPLCPRCIASLEESRRTAA
jgi:uncharacterized paraquat-inducible protein A